MAGKWKGFRPNREQSWPELRGLQGHHSHPWSGTLFLLWNLRENGGHQVCTAYVVRRTPVSGFTSGLEPFLSAQGISSNLPPLQNNIIVCFPHPLFLYFWNKSSFSIHKRSGYLPSPTNGILIEGSIRVMLFSITGSKLKLVHWKENLSLNKLVADWQENIANYAFGTYYSVTCKADWILKSVFANVSW